MILSEIRTNKKNKAIVTQSVDIRCDDCAAEFSRSLLNQRKGIGTYGKDLCRGCKQKHQYKNGLRDKQKEHAANYATNVQKGKTYEELYPSDKANAIKVKLSKASSEHNPRWSLKHRTQEEIDKAKKKLGKRIIDTRKGKSYDEIYGEEKASNI